VFDRLLIVNEHHLRRVLTAYIVHYNTARPHRGLGQTQAPRANAICERMMGTLRRDGCQARSVAGVTANTSPHRRRGISRDSAASHSRSPGW
jgi:hypothetical protein